MKLYLFVLLVLTGIGARSQDVGERNILPLSDAAVKEQAQRLVNSFKVAVIKSVKCKTAKNYNPESILQKFTPGAKIEISSLKTKTKFKKDPDEYFIALKSLCAGINYDSISVSFLPELIADTEIIRFNYSCTVNRQINQVFLGFKNGKSVYCDITIKEIKMKFLLQKDGSYKPFITDISVKDTKSCISEK